MSIHIGDTIAAADLAPDWSGLVVNQVTYYSGHSDIVIVRDPRKQDARRPVSGYGCDDGAGGTLTVWAGQAVLEHCPHAPTAPAHSAAEPSRQESLW